MKSYKTKSSWQNIMESKPVLIILGLLIILFTWSVFGMWQRTEATIKNKEIAAQKLSDLEQQKDKLSSNIDNLQTDEGKEKIFRENYGLAKEGEDLIIITDKSDGGGPAPTKGSFWSRVKSWF